MAVTVTKPVDLRAPWACDIVKGNGFLDHGILEAVEFRWDCSTISAMNQGSVSQQVTLRLCLLLCCWETAPDFCNNLWLSRKLWPSFPVLDVGTSYGDLYIFFFWAWQTWNACTHAQQLAVLCLDRVSVANAAVSDGSWTNFWSCVPWLSIHGFKFWGCLLL